MTPSIAKPSKSSVILNCFKKHAVGVGLIVLSGLYYFAPASKIKPFDPDNLLALTLSEKSPAGFFVHPLASYFPGYRPFAQLLLHLQFKIVGASHISSYFLINILIWIASAVVVYFIIYFLTQSRAGATVSSLAFLLDFRITASILWIGERQNVLCVFLGLLAMFLTIIFSQKKSRINYPQIISISLLLLASFLSKEFALAFIPAVVALGYYLNPKNIKPILIGVISSVGVYFLMRFVFAGSSSMSGYCEDMGYLTSFKHICYSQLSSGQKLHQYLYNIASSSVGTYLPNLFTDYGQLQRPSLDFKLVINLVVLLFSSVALARRKKQALLFALIVISSAILSFSLYRVRNHLVGMTGVYILLGIGFAEVYTKIKLANFFKIFSVGLIVAFILLYNGPKLRSELSRDVKNNDTINPCLQQKRFPKDIDLNIAKQISIDYGLGVAECDK